MCVNGIGAFPRRFKKDQLVLTAPVVGRSLRMEDVPDPVFSQKMMGEGTAYIFDGDTVHAPCSSRVVLFAHTKHAIGLATGDVEILIHVGLDTVTFQGEGFTALVSEGDRVRRGQPLLKLDRDFLSSRDADLTTMMVITSDASDCVVHEPGEVTLDTPSISL